MRRIPERSRLPVLVGVSLLVLLLVAGAVIVAPRLVPPTPRPSPSSDAPGSPSPEPSTPEAAVRAFFSAFSRARKNDDPTLVLPFVTGETSDAYRSVKGFLDGQRAVGKASILTIQRLDNLVVESAGAVATASFDYVEGGYDISLDTGQPLESPNVLPSFRVTVTLKRVDSSWLVDAYTSRQ